MRNERLWSAGPLPALRLEEPRSATTNGTSQWPWESRRRLSTALRRAERSRLRHESQAGAVGADVRPVRLGPPRQRRSPGDPCLVDRRAVAGLVSEHDATIG